MDISELIKSRRTIHNYTPEAVDEALIRKALELVLWAPNHKLTHPWRLTWMGPAARERVAELAVELKMQREPLSDVKQQALRHRFLQPPVMIAVGLRRSPDPAQMREDYASIAAGLQNAALFLWSHGIGTKWSTSGVTRHEKTYEWLGVDPAAEELVGFFWIGHAEKTPAPPDRPSLDECLRKSD